MNRYIIKLFFKIFTKFLFKLFLQNVSLKLTTNEKKSKLYVRVLNVRLDEESFVNKV